MSSKKKSEQLIIFTDGACKGNGKYYAKAGVGVYFPNKELKDISEKFTLKKITNQRAELWAVHRALSMIISTKLIDEKEEIIIYSDSKYTIKVLTEWARKWKKNDWTLPGGFPVKNVDIIDPLYRMYRKYKDKISLKHVRSHTEATDEISLGNQRADELANKGIYSFV